MTEEHSSRRVEKRDRASLAADTASMGTEGEKMGVVFARVGRMSERIEV